MKRDGKVKIEKIQKLGVAKTMMHQKQSGYRYK